jgi:hypothetical protein
MVILSSGRKSRLLLLFFALLFLVPDSEAIEFLRLDEVEAGMQGVGKTVFIGTEVEEFNVEIIDVLRNFLPQRNVILVRLSGKAVDEAGVIEGMSGSPVYVNGKLLGALAYKLGSFTKEPIAGVTPIEEMIRLLEEGGKHGSSRSGAHGFVPIQTPLSIAGLHPEIVDDVKEEFSQYGFTPVTSGGSHEDFSDPPVLEPGAMIGLSLIRGDAEMSMLGTLTLVEDNRIIGFGHGALVAGEVEMPLVSVRVHSVIPSSYLSYKLASGSQVIGTVTQDRVAGVGGVLGNGPRLIPVLVKVKDGEREDTYRYELVQYRFYTPLLVNWVARSSVIASAKSTGDFTIRSTMKIVMEEEREVNLHNTFAGGQAVDNLGIWVYRPVEKLLNNEFEEPKIEKVELNVEVTEENEKARIAGVKLNKTVLKQSDTLHIRVNLIPLSGSPYVEKFAFAVKEVAEGTLLEVLVSSSEAIAAQEAERWPEKFVPATFDHLLTMIENSGASDELVVQIVSPDEAVQVGGIDLPSLPGSVRHLYRSRKILDKTAITKGYPISSIKKNVPHSISGFERAEARMEGAPKQPKETRGGEQK